MKCMLCGTINSDGAIHCVGCGASLRPSSGGPIPAGPRPTVLEGTPAPPPYNPIPSAGPGTAAGGRKTVYVDSPPAPGNSAPGGNSGPASAGGGRKTVYVLHDGPAAPPVDLPPLVGFLSSFSARPDGVYFPVREGRNRFGSDPSQVDHALPWDRAMSGRHFALMVRNGRVRVLDENSTNATRVDGVEIWGDAEDANHGSIIQAGDTTFELTLIPSRSAARKVGGDA